MTDLDVEFLFHVRDVTVGGGCNHCPAISSSPLSGWLLGLAHDNVGAKQNSVVTATAEYW